MLDLGLPDANGRAAIRRARAAAPDTPLVVFTGMDDPDLAALSLQEGAQDYLIKGQTDPRAFMRSLRYATERKRLERLKDEFVSTVSHELRTPLTSIAASLGLLMGKAGGILPLPAIRLLEIAHSNSQRLVRLVNDILDIEKLESGQVVFNLKRVGMLEIVEQAIEASRQFALAQGVRFRLKHSDDQHSYVRADSDRLAQVFANLLSNAVKFSPKNSEVVLSIEGRDDMVSFSVRDHGAGIPAEFKARIFERFAQADATSTRQKSGTGLGLSIVKQIVARLGGEVGFLDAPGGGTIFFIELPRWEGSADLIISQKSEAATMAESGESLEYLVYRMQEQRNFDVNITEEACHE